MVYHDRLEENYQKFINVHRQKTWLRLGLRVPQKVKKSLFTQPTTTKPLLKSKAKWVEIISFLPFLNMKHLKKSTDYFEWEWCIIVSIIYMFSTCFVAFWFNCQIHTSLSSKIAFKKIEGNTSFEKKWNLPQKLFLLIVDIV